MLSSNELIHGLQWKTSLTTFKHDEQSRIKG